MKTQAWGWLAAAVLAAGLNASYHDGGLRWAHEIADRVGHRANAVMALATGHADEFLAEAQILTAGQQTVSSPFGNVLVRAQKTASARIQQRVDDRTTFSNVQLARFEAISDREQAQLIRLEARRAHMEARIAEMRIPAIAVGPAMSSWQRTSICPRIRVNVPRIQIPAAPMVHFDAPAAGPV